MVRTTHAKLVEFEKLAPDLGNIETIEQRLRDSAVEHASQLLGPAQICAWASVPGPIETRDFYTRYEERYGLLWGYFNSQKLTSFTLDLLNAIAAHDQTLHQTQSPSTSKGAPTQVNFYVWASASTKHFNLGGDLAYFIECISSQDRSALMNYATRCIECVYDRINNYGMPDLITLSLIQGDALGGGFEAALTSDFIIAEEQARFGFPEIHFNSFPGMGAYSLVARKAGRRIAEKMMLSGERYSAQTMQEWGLVDCVVAKGQGEAALRAYVADTYSKKTAIAAIYRARQAVFPVTHEELMSITTTWVDAALKLQNKELNVMRKLVQHQLRSHNSTHSTASQSANPSQS